MTKKKICIKDCRFLVIVSTILSSGIAISCSKLMRMPLLMAESRSIQPTRIWIWRPKSASSSTNSTLLSGLKTRRNKRLRVREVLGHKEVNQTLAWSVMILQAIDSSKRGSPTFSRAYPLHDRKCVALPPSWTVEREPKTQTLHQP